MKYEKAIAQQIIYENKDIITESGNNTEKTGINLLEEICKAVGGMTSGYACNSGVSLETHYPWW